MAQPLQTPAPVTLHALDIGLTPRRLVGMTLAVGVGLVFFLGMLGGILKAVQSSVNRPIRALTLSLQGR